MGNQQPQSELSPVVDCFTREGQRSLLRVHVSPKSILLCEMCARQAYVHSSGVTFVTTDAVKALKGRRVAIVFVARCAMSD